MEYLINMACLLGGAGGMWLYLDYVRRDAQEAHKARLVANRLIEGERAPRVVGEVYPKAQGMGFVATVNTKEGLREVFSPTGVIWRYEDTGKRLGDSLEDALEDQVALFRHRSSP